MARESGASPSHVQVGFRGKLKPLEVAVLIGTAIVQRTDLYEKFWKLLLDTLNTHYF